jgi:hypothetical protein
MDVLAQAIKLAEYTRSLPDFVFQRELDCYDHMGALIVDAVLQAGIHYESVVKPRVLRIQRDFPEALSTSAFLEVLSKVGSEKLLDFRGDKPMRVLEVTCLLRYEGIESVSQLADWLGKKDNKDRLSQIKGIKNKTVEYMRILAGADSIAIDRHLMNFLKAAKIDCVTKDEASKVISATATLLGMNMSHYDHSIWTYMSTKTN